MSREHERWVDARQQLGDGQEPLHELHVAVARREEQEALDEPRLRTLTPARAKRQTLCLFLCACVSWFVFCELVPVMGGRVGG